MFRHTQRFAIVLIFLTVNIVVLSGECSAAAPAIRLVVNPNKTDVTLGSGPIALTARARGKNLTYTWELLGPGKLDGKGSAVFYVLPDKIEGSSARALITVTVTDESSQEMTESVTFNLLAPPTPTPTLTPTPKPAPTPTQTPTSTFSLDDLKEAADQEEKAKTTWQAKLDDMEKAFSEVNEYEKRDISAELKNTAWERFLQAFSEDNPHSTRDDELRSAANERIRSWKEGGLPTPTPTPLPPTPTALPPTPTPRPPTPPPTPSEIEQLLKQADTYFDKRWFLTPEETNAFDVYQEVLEIDPTNRHAREKLRDMMRTYKAWGDSNYNKTNYSKAQTFYQRSLKIAQYLVEDLGDQSIIQEFQEVQKQLQALEATPTPSPMPTPMPTQTPLLPTPTPVPTPTPTPRPPTPTPFPTPTPTPTEWHDPVSGIDFVWVPEGCFQMGCVFGIDCDGDEKPVHKVCLDGFWMGKYEITQAQWKKVMRNNPSNFKGDTRPVERVSWDDVQKFLRQLNQKAGKEMYRLPSEAEWEYAARAGTDTMFYFGNDVAGLGKYAWYAENSGKKTHSVGQLKPNTWGLYDMYGNVYEWCQDWYGRGYYSKSPSKNPGGPSSGSARVLRGGGWGSVAGYCRAASRLGISPDARSSIVGFRLLRTP